jgi:hypothetical protein
MVRNPRVRLASSQSKGGNASYCYASHAMDLLEIAGDLSEK